MGTIPVCSGKKIEEEEGGSPCSGFYFVPFPLELMKTSPATLQPTAIGPLTQNILAVEIESNSAWNSPQLHLFLLLCSVTTCTWPAHRDRYVPHTSFSAWQGPAAIVLFSSQIFHKLELVSSMLKLCNGVPVPVKPRPPKGPLGFGHVFIFPGQMPCGL